MTRDRWHEVRTQGAPIFGYIGPTEDAASCRLAPVRRPGSLSGQAPRTRLGAAFAFDTVPIGNIGSHCKGRLTSDRRTTGQESELGAALLTTREGLEASLIVGIILAYLAKTDNRDRFRIIWAGAAAAILVSIVTGAALFFTLGELEGRSERIFEGFAMLSAVAVLTWMIFWMRKQARNVKGELEQKIAGAVAAGSAVGLAAVVFFAVLREGWETALFLFAISESSSPVSTSIGAAVGLAISVALGVGLYMGSRRLNLRQFFTVTGILLIVFAAGLLAHAVHEFQEAGILPTTIEHVWNTNGIVGEDSRPGQFLVTLFGYNGNPSLLEVLVWAGYLATALTLFLRPLVARQVESAPAAA
jgi:high-affinity iron transporter